MPEPVAALRLDRFLWFARIVKTRSFAQAMATSGHLRIDGRAVDRAAAPVRVGNVLTFATHGHRVRVLRVEAIPFRRGPAAEARACYSDLTAPDAAGDANVSQESSEY